MARFVLLLVLLCGAGSLNAATVWAGIQDLAPTGSRIYAGFGDGKTDNTVALNAQIAQGETLLVRPGTYVFSSTIVFPPKFTLSCIGPGSTTFILNDPTGLLDGFYIASPVVKINGCQFLRAQAATSGSLVHIHATYYVWLEHNLIGYANTFNNVTVDCADGVSATEIYFYDNVIRNAENDGILESCPFSNAGIADVFIQNRNYITGNKHAGVELSGSAGWTHIEENDFDNNNFGLLGDSGQGNGSLAASITFGGNHFEGNATDVDLTGYSWITDSANQYVSKNSGSGFHCTRCAGISGGANLYVAGAVIRLNGVAGFSDAGSHFANSVSVSQIQIGPSGAIPSSSIFISGADYPFTFTPLVAFTGASSPATNITLMLSTTQGGCWTGANVDMASFTYICAGASSAVQFPNLPGSAGSGGNYLCVDAVGKFYQKPSCP